MGLYSEHMWIVTHDPSDGRPYLIYGCPASKGSAAAQQHAVELLGNTEFTVRRLPTRDIRAASAMIKNKKSSALRQPHQHNSATRSKIERLRAEREKRGSAW